MTGILRQMTGETLSIKLAARTNDRRCQRQMTGETLTDDRHSNPQKALLTGGLSRKAAPLTCFFNLSLTYAPTSLQNPNTPYPNKNHRPGQPYGFPRAKPRRLQTYGAINRPRSARKAIAAAAQRAPVGA